VDESLLADTHFPIGWCVRCARQVLTALSPLGTETDGRQCVHCDGSIATATAMVSADELHRYGYGPRDEGEGCGRPDCGGGRCGRTSD
jgi:hypothetical protein